MHSVYREHSDVLCISCQTGFISETGIVPIDLIVFDSERGAVACHPSVSADAVPGISVFLGFLINDNFVAGVHSVTGIGRAETGTVSDFDPV